MAYFRTKKIPFLSDSRIRDECINLFKAADIVTTEWNENQLLSELYLPSDVLLWAISKDLTVAFLEIKRFIDQHPDVAIFCLVPKELLTSYEHSIPDFIESVIALPAAPEFFKERLDQVLALQGYFVRIFDLERLIGELNQEMRLFSSIGKAMASSFDLNHVLTAVMEMTGSSLTSEGWSVALKDEKTGELVFVEARGEAGARIKGRRIPRGKGIVGWVTEHGEPLIVQDTALDDRHFTELDRLIGFKSHSILCMPLKSRNRILGAIEFINKLSVPFSSHDMERIQVLVDLAAVSLDNALLYHHMNILSERDELTGLFNQRTLVRILDSEIEKATLSHTSLAYIFLDMDHLKRINDQFGHLMGQESIREVGTLVERSLTGNAIAGRYGGDEFWVILPETSKEQALSLAEIIRSRIERHVFLKKFNLDIRLTASIGIAMYPDHAASFDDLTRNADLALFEAKRNNRNKVVLAAR